MVGGGTPLVAFRARFSAKVLAGIGAVLMIVGFAAFLQSLGFGTRLICRCFNSRWSRDLARFRSATGSTFEPRTRPRLRGRVLKLDVPCPVHSKCGIPAKANPG